MSVYAPPFRHKCRGFLGLRDACGLSSFPSPPAIRLGVFQGTIEGDIRILKSDVFILPGDSGGMLLDLSGQVVGVNDEIRISREVAQPLTGYSIDAGQAFHVGQLLLQGTPAS